MGRASLRWGSEWTSRKSTAVAAIAHGVAAAVVVRTPGGDGRYAVAGSARALLVDDPHAEVDEPPQASRWSTVTPDEIAEICRERVV